MLEVKWKVGVEYRDEGSEISFNPCYVGSKMESMSVGNILLSSSQVSILVMLEVKWKGLIKGALQDA